MEEIKSFVDSDMFVTANWLESTVNVSHESALKLLYDFKSKHNEVIASYLISGETDGRASFVIVPESKKQQFHQDLSIVHEVQIFSVQREDTASMISQLENVETTLLRERLLQQGDITANMFLNNKCGPIKLPNLKVLPVGQRVIDAQNASKPTQLVKDTADERMNKLFASRSADVSSSSFNKSSTKVSSVNNYFSKGSNSAGPTNTSDAASTVGAEVSQPASAVDKKVELAKKGKPNSDEKSKLVKSKSSTEEINSEEEEWDDGSGYKTDPARLAKRNNGKRRIPDLDEDGDEGRNVTEPVTTEDPSSSNKSAKPGKQAVIVHGAMDDFMQEQLEAANGEPVKRKKKKLVEKVFADEKGYLVTENVWEEVSDNEEIVHAAVKPESSMKTAAGSGAASSSGAAAGAKKKPTAASSDKKAPTGQKSMMSFFTKK